MLLPYRAKNPPEHFPYATVALIVINTLIFALTCDGLDDVRPSATAALAVSHSTLSPWRLLTAMFLHGSWSHLAGNMLFLWIFGAAVEGRLRPLRFLAVYVLSGMVGGLLSDLVSLAADPDIANLGASGAIMGIAGAYLYIFPFAAIRVGFLYFLGGLIPRAGVRDWQARWVILYYIGFDVLNYLLFHGSDGVGHFAHLGGVGSGFLAVMVMRTRRDTEDVSAAQAVHADVKDPSDLSFLELESLMQRPTDNPRLVLAYCEKALMAPGNGEQRCLAALQQHVRLLTEQADALTLANVALRLSMAHARQMPSVFFLRLGSKLERNGCNDTAITQYKRICEMDPMGADTEVALFRLGRLFEQSYNSPSQAGSCYKQLLQSFPGGAMADEARRSLSRLGAAAANAPATAFGPSSAGALSSGGVRYDLAGNPLP